MTIKKLKNLAFVGIFMTAVGCSSGDAESKSTCSAPQTSHDIHLNTGASSFNIKSNWTDVEPNTNQILFGMAGLRADQFHTLFSQFNFENINFKTEDIFSIVLYLEEFDLQQSLIAKRQVKGIGIYHLIGKSTYQSFFDLKGDKFVLDKESVLRVKGVATKTIEYMLFDHQSLGNLNSVFILSQNDFNYTSVKWQDEESFKRKSLSSLNKVMGPDDPESCGIPCLANADNSYCFIETSHLSKIIFRANSFCWEPVT